MLTLRRLELNLSEPNRVVAPRFPCHYFNSFENQFCHKNYPLSVATGQTNCILTSNRAYSTSKKNPNPIKSKAIRRNSPLRMKIVNRITASPHESLSKWRHILFYCFVFSLRRLYFSLSLEIIKITIDCVCSLFTA